MPRSVQGLSGVSWWAWLVLGVVLVLISIVVLRMLCATKQVDISIYLHIYIFNIFILYVSILSTNHHQTAADHGTKPELRQRQRLRQQQTQRPDMKPPAAPQQQQQQQQQQLQPQPQQQPVEAEYPGEIVTTYPAHYVHFSEEGGGAGHYYGYQDPRLPFYGAEDPYYRHYGPPYPAQPTYPAQYEAVLPHPQQGEGDKGEVPYAHVRYANSDTVYTV